MSDDSSCLFCRIIRGDISADIVHSDEHTVAFRDNAPQAPIHVLVVPRLHVAGATALMADDLKLWSSVMMTATRVARDQGVDQSGYRLVINNGPDAAQTVQHLHVHVLGGRVLSWPPG